MSDWARVVHMQTGKTAMSLLRKRCSSRALCPPCAGWGYVCLGPIAAAKTADLCPSGGFIGQNQPRCSRQPPLVSRWRWDIHPFGAVQPVSAPTHDRTPTHPLLLPDGESAGRGTTTRQQDSAMSAIAAAVSRSGLECSWNMAPLSVPSTTTNWHVWNMGHQHVQPAALFCLPMPWHSSACAFAVAPDEPFPAASLILVHDHFTRADIPPVQPFRAFHHMDSD
jgi:hypothetical protein